MAKEVQEPEQKLCTKALDALLNLVCIFGDNPSAFIFAYPGIEVSAGFKECILLRPEPLKREYMEHIPTCPACKKVYYDFLDKEKKPRQSIADVDKKYLSIYDKLQNPA